MPVTKWANCIKHHSKARLNKCSLLPRIRYTIPDKFLGKQKNAAKEQLTAAVMKWKAPVFPSPVEFISTPRDVPLSKFETWSPEEGLGCRPKKKPEYEPAKKKARKDNCPKVR
ncbi:hypothetical protein K470DRAFT_269079 [Piedraia hortae CBS 480.64]|uniref:Uncharacterized protein n=1 Tax=Piedraia hortae CBS 480.64 TaxID=1314780 RepID=A0A6A7C4Q3_9PEZI|nr:hypothetical protein K470DRAFT_269079 [Piedraia hortae CBS 480.64]